MRRQTSFSAGWQSCEARSADAPAAASSRSREQDAQSAACEPGGRPSEARAADRPTMIENDYQNSGGLAATNAPPAQALRDAFLR